MNLQFQLTHTHTCYSVEILLSLFGSTSPLKSHVPSLVLENYLFCPAKFFFSIQGKGVLQETMQVLQTDYLYPVIKHVCPDGRWLYSIHRTCELTDEDENNVNHMICLSQSPKVNPSGHRWEILRRCARQRSTPSSSSSSLSKQQRREYILQDWCPVEIQKHSESVPSLSETSKVPRGGPESY